MTWDEDENELGFFFLYEHVLLDNTDQKLGNQFYMV